MTTIYIAFYDEEDGCDRESWSVFYTPFVAATTQQKAYDLAEAAIKKMIVEMYGEDDYEDMKDQYHIELQEVELVK